MPTSRATGKSDLHFWPAKKFLGARANQVFKRGMQGLWYYSDGPMVRTISLAAEVRPLSQCHPVLLGLDELVNAEKLAQAKATAEVDKIQAPVWENRGTMTSEQVEFVAGKREEAIRRKTLRTLQEAVIEMQAVTASVDEMQSEAIAEGISNEPQLKRPRKEEQHTCPRPRNRCSKRRLQEGSDEITWPRDGSISMYNTSHVASGCWAFDTINPNCWGGAAGYTAGTKADFVAVQETKVPDH